MPTPIGTLGAIDTLLVGGRTFTDISSTTGVGSLISLYQAAGGNTNVYGGWNKFGSQSSTAYPVTTGKTLIVAAIRVINSAAVAETLGFGQCDNALAIATPSTPTNPIYFGIESSTNTPIVTTAATIGWEITLHPHGKIAATKFGFTATGGTVSSNTRVYSYGYEF